MACEYCEITEGKRPALKLYEDEKAIAMLSPQPAAIGHIVVIPKRHAPIMEVLGDDETGTVFSIANKMSIALFESVKCEGTNILVSNGIEAGQEEPHFSINVIARKAGDGLSFEWVPKRLGEEEMATVELQMREELAREETPGKKHEKTAVHGEKEGKEEKKEEETPEKKEAAEEKKPVEEKEESYLIKQLRRMP